MCFDLGFASFGCSGPSVSTSLLNSDFISSVTSILSQDSNTTTVGASATQSIIISIGPSGRWLCAGGLSINQTLSANVKFLTNLTSQTQASVMNLFTQAINNSITQQNAITEGWLSNLPQGSSVTDVKNILTNAVNSSLSLSNINNIVQQYNFQQNIVLNINGIVTSQSDCSISQDMVLDLISQDIINSVITAAASNQTFNQLTTASAQQQTITATGPLQDLTGLVTGAISAGGIIVAIIIVAIIAGLGFILYEMLKNPEGTKQLGESVSQVAKTVQTKGAVYYY